MRGSQARRWGLVADAAPEACVLGRSWTTSTHEPNRSVPLAFPLQPGAGYSDFRPEARAHSLPSDPTTAEPNVPK